MTDDAVSNTHANPCGCREEGGYLIACRIHWIAMEFGFFHANMDGHEECCDKPQMEGLVKEYGRADVAAAIEVTRPGWQDYLRRVLEMAA